MKSALELCEAEAEYLRALYRKKMWFRSCAVAYDDAGPHVELRVSRPDLMGAPPPHCGTLETRVCVVVVG